MPAALTWWAHAQGWQAVPEGAGLRIDGGGFRVDVEWVRADLATGFSFHIPPAAVGAAVGAGLGVAAAEQAVSARLARSTSDAMRRGAVIGDGSVINSATLRRCVLGVRSHIGEGALLEDVVMMGADYYETPEQLAENKPRGRPPIGIGRNCRIRHAIIDKNARIGDNVTLDPAGKADGKYLEGAVIIRDGVLAVPKGATLPTGTTF